MKNREIHRVFIVGNKGAMGRLFEKIISAKDVAVTGIDVPADYSDKNTKEKLYKSDMVLLCVPIHTISEVVSTIRDRVKDGCIMVDICSVKVMPIKSMLNLYEGPVVGTHPLFGPEPDTDLPLKVAMVRARGDKEFHMVRDLFEKIGLITFECSASEHDEAMAFIQGLNFVTTLSYFAAFSENNDLLKFITPSFKRRLDAAKKMLTQDSSLFQTMFEANPYSHEAVKKFRSFLNLASAGDLDLLIQKAWWWWKRDNKGDVG